jgi:hypothetical protein
MPEIGDVATVNADGARITGTVYHVRDCGWPCVETAAGRFASGPTDEIIDAAITGIMTLADAGDISLGGIEEAEARRRMNLIVESGRADDRAMQCYDLLYRFVTHGRPW